MRPSSGFAGSGGNAITMLRWMPATASAWSRAEVRRHHRAPVAALRAEARVAEAAHQLGPQRGDALRRPCPARAGDRRSRSPASTARRRRRRRPDRRRARAGSVSGPMIFVNSATEPGQPCVMTSGSGFGPLPRAWMKWMPSPPTAARNCGNAFSARLGGAPVVAVAPVGDQLAQVGEVGAVVPARAGDLVGKARAREALAQIGEHGVGDGDAKRLDAACAALLRFRHGRRQGARRHRAATIFACQPARCR